MRQPLAVDTSQRAVHAGLIVVPRLDPVAVAEVKFREVAVQMSLGHMEIAAINAPLQDAEVAFDRVREGVPRTYSF